MPRKEKNIKNILKSDEGGGGVVKAVGVAKVPPEFGVVRAGDAAGDEGEQAEQFEHLRLGCQSGKRGWGFSSILLASL